MTSQCIVGKQLRSLGRGASELARRRDFGMSSRYGLTRTGVVAAAVFCMLPIAATAAFYFSNTKDNLTISVPSHQVSIPVRLPDIRSQMTSIDSGSELASHGIFATAGETLTSLLVRLGVTDKELERYILATPETRPLLYPKEGQFITATVHDDGTLQNLKLFFDGQEARPSQVVEVSRTGSDLSSNVSPYEFDVQLTMGNGVVRGTPDGSLQKSNIPSSVIDQMHRAFDYDRDIVAQLDNGDAFRVVYESKFAEGNFVRYGRLLAMQLEHGGKTTELYWFNNDGRDGAYYDAKGNIAKRTFMRVPLDIKSVSSEFAPMRRHPVTGILRPHQGTDFRAPWGAIVRAAADGKVEFAGVGTGYGNYIRIQHGPNIVTVYAHLSSIAHGITKGVEVTRGEIIGRVGQTGLATGPHLHYELRLDGKQINPMKVDFPDTATLTPYQLAQLEVNRAPPHANLPRHQ